MQSSISRWNYWRSKRRSGKLSWRRGPIIQHTYGHTAVHKTPPFLDQKDREATPTGSLPELPLQIKRPSAKAFCTHPLHPNCEWKPEVLELLCPQMYFKLVMTPFKHIHQNFQSCCLRACGSQSRSGLQSCRLESFCLTTVVSSSSTTQLK